MKQPEEMSDALAVHVARAIDEWHAIHPALTVMQMLAALERIRHVLTEAFLGAGTHGAAPRRQ